MKKNKGRSGDLINKVRDAINSGINSDDEYRLEELINKEPRWVVGAPPLKKNSKKRWYTGPRGRGSRVGKEHREAVQRAKKERDMQTLSADVARLIWAMEPGLWYTKRDLEAVAGDKAAYALILLKKQRRVEIIKDPEYTDVKVCGYGSSHRGGLVVTRYLYRLNERGVEVRDQCLALGTVRDWKWTGERWEKIGLAE